MSFKVKFSISLFSSFLFIVIVYFRDKSESVLSYKPLRDLISTLLFFVITMLTMNNKSSSRFLINIKHSIYGTLLYYFISSSTIYLLLLDPINSIFGKNDINRYIVLVIQTLIFCISLVGLMYLP